MARGSQAKSFVPTCPVMALFMSLLLLTTLRVTGWLNVQSRRSNVATKGNSPQKKLPKFLFDYRITPHTTTGVAPAQLLMNRRLRSRFNRLFPDLQGHVQKKQTEQAASHNNLKLLRSFKVGDPV